MRFKKVSLSGKAWKSLSYLGVTFNEDDMETSYQKDCSQGLAHIHKDIFPIQNCTFKYKYQAYALQIPD
jgi:hypothetical protein